MDHIIDDNRACLEQGIQLIEKLPPEDYTRRCASCFDSAIGGHIRHNTDHYAQFLAGYGRGRIDYQARSRDRQVETDREHAMTTLGDLRARLEAVPDTVLDAIVEVRADGGAADAWSRSTVRRELQFLLSHSIHHYALIKVIAAAHGCGGLPADFGVAPSTLQHRAAEAAS